MSEGGRNPALVFSNIVLYNSNYNPELYRLYTTSEERCFLKSNKTKWIVLSVVFVLILVTMHLIHGINKNIDKTIILEAYEDNDWTPDKDTSVTMKGNFRKTLFSSSFAGTFAIEYYEPSCREGAEAKIEWHDNYQSISYFNAGDFFTPDIRIDIDEGMQRMMIVLNNETIMKS